MISMEKEIRAKGKSTTNPIMNAIMVPEDEGKQLEVYEKLERVVALSPNMDDIESDDILVDYQDLISCF